MKKSTLSAIVALPALLLISAQVFAQSTNAVASDNTKSNQVSSSDHNVTADKQGNDATDLDLAKRIRRSVMADSSLSTYAHNVKIVAVHGTVTLNGVVRSPEEKAQINQMATSVAGAGHVVDDMKVAPPK